MTASGQPAGSAESLFLQCLPIVDRIILTIARRNSLARCDADEFASWARGRLTDGDYAILRKYRGRSSIATYLMAVLANLFRDYRNSAWGRWRPSATAVRHGAVAIRLEELLCRDECPLREAIGILRSAGMALTERELIHLAGRLPRRPAAREVSLDDLRASSGQLCIAPSAIPDDRADVEQALQASIAELPDEDRIITKMRYWDDVSVADIARARGLHQKPLYRRIESIQRRLKLSLARHGVTEESARDI